MGRTEVLAVAFSVLALATQASAATDPVAARQTTMKQLGLHMRDVTPFTNGKAPYDTARVQALMAALAADGKKLQGLFPASSKSDPRTNALPAVWQNKADFEKRLAELVKTANAGQKATTLETFRPAYATLAGSCKGCHDTYRKPN